MTSSGEITVAASRLRGGDLIPAHGNARISRPPVVSPDGSMMTVVLAVTGAEDSPGQSLRVLRIPVDQPVSVIRTVNTSGRHVRKSRVVRSSGAQVAVLDLLHTDSEIQPLEGKPFATLCATHHTIVFHASVSTAEAIASHPEEWCGPCAQVTHSRAQARVYGDRPVVRRSA